METYGEFEDSSISDKVVKKAWKELKKAATNLPKIVNQTNSHTQKFQTVQ